MFIHALKVAEEHAGQVIHSLSPRSFVLHFLNGYKVPVVKSETSQPGWYRYRIPTLLAPGMKYDNVNQIVVYIPAKL